MQSLSLTDLNFSCVSDLQLFTNLTASSQLTSLGLSEGDENNPSEIVPLPQGALRHMFLQGKQWPFLEFLRVEVGEASVDGVEGWCVDATDISRLASCLPALNALILDDCVKDIPAVAALTQLMPGLKDLTVGGEQFDNRAAPHVAKLTLLESLTWVSTSITSVEHQKLTALTGLLSLIVHDCPDLDERVLNVEGSHGWMNALELDPSPEVRHAQGLAPQHVLRLAQRFSKQIQDGTTPGCRLICWCAVLDLVQALRVRTFWGMLCWVDTVQVFVPCAAAG